MQSSVVDDLFALLEALFDVVCHNPMYLPCKDTNKQEKYKGKRQKVHAYTSYLS